MFKKQALSVFIAGALLSIGSISMAADKMVWITLGDEAFRHLQAMAPKTVAADSKMLKTSKTALAKQEKVHLVRVSEAMLPKLSATLHSQSHRCGGFVFHADEAAGRAALVTTQAAPTLAQVRPSYAIANQEFVNQVLPNMQDSNIAQTIVDLSTNFPNRYYTTSGGVNASNWLLNKWQGLIASRDDMSVTQFTHPGWPQKSVILTMPGTDNGSEVVVLGAHLDSINTSGTGETTLAPGADDDASGVASMTEAIRALVAFDFKPRRTIKFIAYAAEEVGLRGSAEIAASYRAANTQVVGVMQLDMTNYKGAANDIYLFTDYTDSLQNSFVENLIRTYQPNLRIGFDVCNYGCSDHASWDRNGYYTSMPFEATLSASNRAIHTTGDTFAASGNSAQHALKFAKLAASYAIEMGYDGPGRTVPADRVETFSGTLTRGTNRLFGPFRVAAGGSFTARTTGTGDMDLYVRRNAAPTTGVSDCRSTGSTATETCRVSFTANGDAYVLVDGYTAGSYNLTVTYTPQVAGISSKK